MRGVYLLVAAKEAVADEEHAELVAARLRTLELEQAVELLDEGDALYVEQFVLLVVSYNNPPEFLFWLNLDYLREELRRDGRQDVFIPSFSLQMELDRDVFALFVVFEFRSEVYTWIPVAAVGQVNDLFRVELD